MDKSKTYNLIYNGTPELLSALLCAAGVFFPMPCAGRGVCGKCRVKASGALSAPDSREKEILTEQELSDGIRLACRAYALGDVSVCLLSDNTIASFEQESNEAPLPERAYAFADIGTTTIAVSLCDESLVRLREKTVLNPQTAFGSDVMTRLQKSLDGEGDLLKRAVCEALTESLTDICPDASLLEGLVITGNTSMLYLLTGRNPDSLTHAPFEADCLFGELIPPNLISTRLPSRLPVYLPKCASAFIGADIICSILAAEKEHSFLSKGTNILADIGTNGEIALSHNGRIFACSTAAGPAFEGACLHCGSVARAGAVSSVKISGGHIVCGVIGGENGKTLCGSGALDAVSVMLTAGIIDDTGYIKESGHEFTKHIVPGEHGNSFILPDTEVTLTQEDIRSIQLAKSAVCAGILTLIKQAGLTLESIDALFIAGGFGSFLSKQSASHIGLFPQGLADRVIVLGNASLRGAESLNSETAKKDSDLLCAGIQTLELSSSPDFFDEYINNMTFTA